MNKFVTCLLAALTANLAFADSKNLQVVYEGLKFYAPSNAKVVGFLGTDSDILLLKYSEQPGKKIIGFSIDKELNYGSCEPKEFFEATLDFNSTNCGSEALDAFRHVFVKDRDHGAFSGTKGKFYYFIGKDHSTIFYVLDGANDRVLKVESNFLPKDKLKFLIHDHL